MTKLRHLTITFLHYDPAAFELVYKDLVNTRLRNIHSWTIIKDGRLFFKDLHRGRLVGSHIAEVCLGSYRAVEWDKLESFQCGPIPREMDSPVDNPLEGFATALEEDEDGSVPELPLRRLGLDLGYYMGWKIRYEGSTERFDTLFRLLSFTHVESLEFTSVVTIPNLQLGAQLKTVKILRISGSECTFQAEGCFAAFHRLLSACPHLVQLHLVGDKLLNLRTTGSVKRLATIKSRPLIQLTGDANRLSKLETLEQSFRYPSLHVLLFFLRTTKVKIFTYRGESEKREMRWTRMNETDDFDRDCWTL